MRAVIKQLNVARHVCTHLTGKDHHFIHRAVVGSIIMVSGAILIKVFGHGDTLAVAVAVDTVGLSMHGIGLIPFVEEILEIEV